MYQLEGKTAIVTGAGGRHGIGRAIALRLAEEGANVTVNDVALDPSQVRALDLETGWRGIQSVAQEIMDRGSRALAVQADISIHSEVEDLVNSTVQRFGRLDIFICNAAAPPGKDRKPVLDLTEEAFDDVFRVNVKGTFLCAQAAARQMVRQGGGGRIVIMSSSLGKQPRADYAAYSASKAALIAFTQALALELAPHRITVNSICPGPVDTERFDQVGRLLAMATGRTPEEIRGGILADRARDIPLGRVAQPEDIANTAAFLSSKEADYLTGLAISVTGGWVTP